MRQRDKKKRMWVCLYKTHRERIGPEEGGNYKSTPKLVEARLVCEHRVVQTFFQLDKKGRKTFKNRAYEGHFVDIGWPPGECEKYTVEGPFNDIFQ